MYCYFVVPYVLHEYDFAGDDFLPFLFVVDICKNIAPAFRWLRLVLLSL